MKNFLNLGITTSALLTISLQAHAVTFIDTFESGSINLEVSANNLISSGSADSSDILGGTRKIDLMLNITDDRAFASTNLFTNSNNFSHSNNIGASSTAKIIYDAAGSGLGVDLLDLGNSFSVNVTNIDLSTQLEVSVTDKNDRSSSVTSPTISNPQQILFDFDNFSGVDLSSIDEISLLSQGGLNVDVEIDSFLILGNTIKEPVFDTVQDSTPVSESNNATGLIIALGLGFLIEKNFRKASRSF